MHKLATLAYLTYNNEVLLLYRNKKVNDFHEGKYVAIGGRVEPGETPRECILREIQEEAGYRLLNDEISFRGYIYFDEISREKGSEDLPAFNWLVFIYSTAVSKKNSHNNVEGDLQWFPFNKIPYDKMWDGDRLFTPKILETNDIIEGKFVYEGNQIKNWTFGHD
jgi:8-oxo-dGTP diphosphatase